MNIQCPACKALYAIPEEKFSKPVIKAVCKKCSTKMIIDRDARTVQTTSETESQLPVKTTFPTSSSETSGSPSRMPSASEEAAFESRPFQPGMSVSSMSPEYPKYRDFLIIGIMIVILVIALAGGYFFIMRTETAFKKFSQNKVFFNFPNYIFFIK
ncbi:MAG: zinc-ribbon domain-containing protein [Desulfatiglandales bacterium]|nr:zinc-ribbon domain-containing protein [Desulfatiglandales bacterium]